MKNSPLFPPMVPILAGALALALAMAPANAQDKSAAKEMQGNSLSLGNMMGGDMKTTFDGSYEIEYDQNSSQLVRLKVTKKVHVRSGDTLDLDCDLLIYDAQEGHMVATGEPDKPVHFKMQGVTATCQKLDLYPNEGKAVLTGKPVVRQIQPNGSAIETSGKKVTMIQQDGKTRVIVDSGGEGGQVSSSANGASAGSSGSGGGSPAAISVPMSAVNGGNSSKAKPSPSPAPKSGKTGLELLNPAPKAASGRKAPAVSQ